MNGPFDIKGFYLKYDGVERRVQMNAAVILERKNHVWLTISA